MSFTIWHLTIEENKQSVEDLYSCVPLGLTNQGLLTTALIRRYVSFFFVNNVAMLSKGVRLPIFFLPLLGVYWTQKMSSVTSSPTLCPQRSGTGWLLPSRGKWGWCWKGQRKNPGSGVLSMQYKLGYLWKGKGACNCFALVAAQVPQIAPVVCDDTMRGDGGEYVRPEDLRELGDDSLKWRIL